MHPSDWYDIITSVTDVATTTSGAAAKNPLFVVAGGFGDGVAPRLWGLPVVTTSAVNGSFFRTARVCLSNSSSL